MSQHCEFFFFFENFENTKLASQNRACRTSLTYRVGRRRIKEEITLNEGPCRFSTGVRATVRDFYGTSKRGLAFVDNFAVAFES